MSVVFVKPHHAVFFLQGLVNVALDILSRIHTIPTVPIVDCFQKIRQQVKCYLQLAGVMGKNECMQVRWKITLHSLTSCILCLLFFLQCFIAENIFEL